MLTKKQKEYSNYLKRYKEIFCVGIYYYGIKNTETYEEEVLDSNVCSQLASKGILVHIAHNRYKVE